MQILGSRHSSGDGAQEIEFLTSSLGNSNAPLVFEPQKRGVEAD